MTPYPSPLTPEAEKIAAGLTEAQRSALVPFTCFSNKTGRELKRLGLLIENDGVWNHTSEGMAVYRVLQRESRS
jgi:hypothetical protein